MSGGIQGKRTLLSSLAKGKQHENGADEESSSVDPFLIGQTPRGALRTKHLLETIASFNRILDLRQDRAEYRNELAAIYKSPDHRYNDLRIAEKMECIKGKMDIQRAPNAMQREKGVDVTPIMDGKLMLKVLRAGPHKKHLIEELLLRDVTDIHENTPWNKLCKKMKTATKNDKGCFEPLTFFFKENLDNIMGSKESLETC